MYQASAAFMAALRRSRVIDIAVYAWYNGHLIGEIPFSTGSIQMDSNARNRRVLTGNFPAGVSADKPGDPLNPYGSELEVQYGIVFPDGNVEYVPVFYGAVTDAVEDRWGGNQVTAVDNVVRISQARFWSPRTVSKGQSTIALITSLITEIDDSGQVADDAETIEASQAKLAQAQKDLKAELDAKIKATKDAATAAKKKAEAELKKDREAAARYAQTQRNALAAARTARTNAAKQKKLVTAHNAAVNLAKKNKEIAQDKSDISKQANIIAHPGITIADVGLVTFERDRDAAIDDLARSIGAEWFALPTGPIGSYMVRPVPTLKDAPVWTVDATGEHGVSIDTTKTRTRSGIWNAVVAEGDPQDGSAPVRGYAHDDNPASPTRFGGPLGEKTRFYSSPLIKTKAQAESAADALLAKSLGFASSRTIDFAPNPCLEPGDVVTVVFPDGTSELHVIDSLTLPLSVGDNMSLTTRSTGVEGDVQADETVPLPTLTNETDGG